MFRSSGWSIFIWQLLSHVALLGTLLFAAIVAPASAAEKPKVRTITAFVRLDTTQYQQQVTDTLTMLRNAKARTPWLAVTLEKFGRHKLSPAKGLLTIGDAASFIDPFTGSGMLMALESGELAANAISDHLSQSASKDIDELSANYKAAYEQSFDSRLRVCSLMRRAAFTPGIAAIAISMFGLSYHVRHFIARGTRRPSKANVSSLHP